MTENEINFKIAEFFYGKTPKLPDIDWWAYQFWNFGEMTNARSTIGMLHCWVEPHGREGYWEAIPLDRDPRALFNLEEACWSVKNWRMDITRVRSGAHVVSVMEHRPKLGCWMIVGSGVEDSMHLAARNAVWEAVEKRL